jgi:uncharacterized protein
MSGWTGEDPAQRALRHLHAEVDRRAQTLHSRHAARLSCQQGCSGCCVDALTCFEVEADAIARAHPALLAEGIPHPEGRCAFLDEAGACRIYAQRPYVCRTQGLPLRWIDQVAGSGELAEYRDICPLNEDGRGPPVQTLAAEDCFTLGPVEQALGVLQRAVDGGAGRRVPLRALFRRRATPSTSGAARSPG